MNPYMIMSDADEDEHGSGETPKADQPNPHVEARAGDILSCMLRPTSWGETIPYSLSTTFEELRAAIHGRDGQRLLWLIAGFRAGVEDIAAREYLKHTLARPEARHALASMMAPHAVLGQVRSDELVQVALDKVRLAGAGHQHDAERRRRIFNYTDIDGAARYRLETDEISTFHAVAPDQDAHRLALSKPRARFSAADIARSLGRPLTSTVGHFLADELMQLVRDPVRLHNARCSHAFASQGQSAGLRIDYETMRPVEELARLIAIAEDLLRTQADIVLFLRRPTSFPLDLLARTIRPMIITDGEWADTISAWQGAGVRPRHDNYHLPTLAAALAAILRMPQAPGVGRYGAARDCMGQHILTYLLSGSADMSSQHMLAAATERLAALHLRALLDELAEGDTSSPTLAKPAPLEVTTALEPSAERSCTLRVYSGSRGIMDDLHVTIQEAGFGTYRVECPHYLPTLTVQRPGALAIIYNGEERACEVIEHLVSEAGNHHTLHVRPSHPLTLPHTDLEVSMTLDGVTGESRNVNVTSRQCIMYKRRRSDAYRDPGVALPTRADAHILQSEGGHVHLHVQIDIPSFDSWLRDDGDIWIEHEHRRYQVSSIVQADMLGYDHPSQTHMFFFHVRVEPSMPTVSSPR